VSTARFHGIKSIPVCTKCRLLNSSAFHTLDLGSVDWLSATVYKLMRGGRSGILCSVGEHGAEKRQQGSGELANEKGKTIDCA